MPLQVRSCLRFVRLSPHPLACVLRHAIRSADALAQDSASCIVSARVWFSADCLIGLIAI
jgi:hypothetical protein